MHGATAPAAVAFATAACSLLGSATARFPCSHLVDVCHGDDLVLLQYLTFTTSFTARHAGVHEDASRPFTGPRLVAAAHLCAAASWHHSAAHLAPPSG